MTKKLGSTGGFTLIEVVIVLAIIAVLAGILAPTLISYVSGSRISKAEVDVRIIAASIGQMYGDTGHWPIWVAGGSTKAGDTKFDNLESNDGVRPDDGTGSWFTSDPISGADTTNADDLDDQLIDNAPVYPTTGRRAWRGPYIERVLADPWGSKYMVNVKWLQPANVGGTKPSFVLSAGPNKNVETNFDQAGPSITVSGDDIVFRIK